MIILALLNLILKPLLILLTIPVTILTLGLFLLIINTFIVIIADWLVPGFHVEGFFWAFVFALTLSLLNFLLDQLWD